jgi:hypothetical protein
MSGIPIGSFPGYYSRMPKRTEKRLRDLCEQAITAKDQPEVERKASELRAALEEHISAARESLSTQASVIPVLDSIATGKSGSSEVEPDEPQVKP